MIINVHPVNPEVHKINKIVECLQDGGVIIYPTDTVYGFGCDILNLKAADRICRIRRLDPKKAMLSLICKDISQVAEYAWQIDNPLFKLLKRNFPGPFTFILKSGRAVPKLFKNRKNTIGVRIPDHAIAQAIVAGLGRPLLSASLVNTDEDYEDYLTDPEEMEEKYGHQVDMVIDGGIGGKTPSTLVNCVDEPFEVIREGAGVLKF